MLTTSDHETCLKKAFCDLNWHETNITFISQHITEVTINLLESKTLFTIETKIEFTDDDLVKFDHGQIIWSTLVKNWLN